MYETLIDDICTRIANIVLTDSDILTAVTVYPNTLSDDTLPLAIVDDGAVITQSIPNVNTFRVTRSFVIDIYYEKLRYNERYDYGATNRARKLLTTIPRLFANNDRLELNDSGLRYVVQTAIQSDEGVGTAGYRKETYVGVQFTVNVTYELPLT